MGILGIFSSFFKHNPEREVPKEEVEGYLDLSVFARSEEFSGEGKGNVVIVKRALPESCPRYVTLAKRGSLVIMTPVGDPSDFARVLEDYLSREEVDTIRGVRVSLEVGREYVVLYDIRYYNLKVEK